MNLIIQRGTRSAFLLTDTAAIGVRTGRIVHFTNKVIPIYVDGTPVAAVASSGRLESHCLAGQLQKRTFSSLQMFLDQMPEIFRSTERAIVERDVGGPMAAVVAAFDRSRMLPIGFAISNCSEPFPPEFRPYKLNSLSMHITEFDPDDAVLRMTDFRDHRQWNPERDALALIEAQRRDPDITTGLFSIGGQAVLTCLDAKGLSSKVLKTWPDRIGHRIAPDASPRLSRWRDLLAAILR